MYPSGLMTTPDPRLCSFSFRGTAPKKRLKNGSSKRGFTGLCTTWVEEILTTDGITFFTIGANDPLNGTPVSGPEAAATLNHGCADCLPRWIPTAALMIATSTSADSNNQIGAATLLRINRVLRFCASNHNASWPIIAFSPTKKLPRSTVLSSAADGKQTLALVQ